MGDIQKNLKNLRTEVEDQRRMAYAKEIANGRKIEDAIRLAEQRLQLATWEKIQQLGPPDTMSEEAYAKLAIYTAILVPETKQNVSLINKLVETYVPKAQDKDDINLALKEQMLERLQSFGRQQLAPPKTVEVHVKDGNGTAD